MGNNLRGEKRLRNQLWDLNGKAKEAFVAEKMACSAMALDFQVKEIEEEM